MLNSLDLLVIESIILVVVGILGILLMFLSRNEKIKKLSFYIVSALAIYTGCLGFYIGKGLFPIQMVIGIIVVLVGVIAITLSVFNKNNEKKFKLTQVLSALALIIGFVNSIL